MIGRILPIISRSVLSENPVATSDDTRDEQLPKHFSGFSTTSLKKQSVQITRLSGHCFPENYPVTVCPIMYMEL